MGVIMKKYIGVIIAFLCTVLLFNNVIVFGYTEESYLNAINELENVKTSFDLATKKVEEKHEEEKMKEKIHQEELKRQEELNRQKVKEQFIKKEEKNNKINYV